MGIHVCSITRGTPSRQRTRQMRYTNSFGSMESFLATSASGCSTVNSYTTELTVPPSRLSCSRVKPCICADLLMNSFVGRLDGVRLLTKVPEPRRRATSPRFSSSFMAFLMVILLTPYWSQSSIVVGILSFGL